MGDTLGRYENALLYGPGMAVGRYPEVSAATMPGGVTPLPGFAPMQFAPEIVSAGDYGGGGGVFAQQATPGAALAAGAAGAGLGALAGPITSLATRGIGALAGLSQGAGGYGSLAPDFLSKFAGGAKPIALGEDFSSLFEQLPVGSWDGAATALPPEAFGSIAEQLGPEFLSNPGFAGSGAGSTAGSLAAGAGDFALNLGAGALGSWGGGTLARSLVTGDEQQGVASSVGGSVGGAIGTAILPGIGTLIGAFLGSLAGGTIGAGQPDYPYAGTNLQFGAGENGPVLNIGQASAVNGGNPNSVNFLARELQSYLTGRAAAEGYAPNAELVNRDIGYVGTFKNDLRYRPINIGEDAGGLNLDDGRSYGDDLSALGNDVFGDLVARGFYARPGTTTPWATVQQGLTPQAAQYGDGGEAGGSMLIREAGPAVYGDNPGSRAAAAATAQWEADMAAGFGPDWRNVETSGGYG